MICLINCFSDITSSSLSTLLYISRQSRISLDDEAISCRSSIKGNLAEILKIYVGKNFLGLFYMIPIIRAGINMSALWQKWTKVQA